MHQVGRRRLYGSLVGCGLLGLLAVACSSSSKPSSEAGSTTTSSAGSSTTASSAAASTVPAGNTASAPGVTADSIKVGLITSETGVASAVSIPGIAKGFQARIDQQNAMGGVNGRKIVTIVRDDGSTPSGALTAAQDEVNAGVFAIDDNSAFVFGASQYLKGQNMPVVGGGYDAPEWTLPSYSNMFSTSYGVFTTSPAYTTEPLFIKERGGTSLAVFGYGISPSSKGSALAEAQAAKYIGLKVPYVNTSIPFGSVDADRDRVANEEHRCR